MGDEKKEESQTRMEQEVGDRHRRRLLAKESKKILLEMSVDNDQIESIERGVPLSDNCNLSFLMCCSPISEIHASFTDSSSESSDNSSQSCDTETLPCKLQSWAKTFNVTNSAVSALLQILHPYDSSLPLDARTLMNTPRALEVKQCCAGSFLYFGISKGICKILGKYSLTDSVYPVVKRLYMSGPNSSKLLTLTVNIDGLPMEKSSSLAFWPILGILDQSECKSPFIIAMYQGQSKPADANLFLKDFTEECLLLEKDGIEFKGEKYRFRLSCFIADAPARAFLKNIASHNSLNGCEKCVQEGVYLGRTVWPYTEKLLKRNDNYFERFLYKDHQLQRSILSTLEIGLVSQVPLDWMHLICLGVVKKLILSWVEKGPKCVKLRASSITQISERLVALACYLPKEFARKPRPLCYIKFWKATELRSFLLYWGPVVLKNVLPSSIYVHFLYLSVACYILCTPELCTDHCWVRYADELLHAFIKSVDHFYCREMLVYNFHNLLHIADDVLNYGPLDDFSAFPFENYMQKIKKMVRGPNKKLQQIGKRLGEKSFKFCSKQDVSEVTIRQGAIVSVFLGDLNCNYGVNPPDNCFLSKENNLLLIHGIKKNVYLNTYDLKCSFMKNAVDFFSVPLPSSHLNICKCFIESPVNHYITVNPSELKRKCILVSNFEDDSYVCYPYANIKVST
jgi:hypothetical protein